MARLTVRVGPIDGAALRKARTDSDRLIREVADEAGISKQFLNTLELGYSEYMSRPKFNRLVAALGVTDPDSLIKADEPEGRHPEAAAGGVPGLQDDERAEPEEVSELRGGSVEREAS